ncbi:hypothetical protein JCM14719A_24080 [Calditerricola satsumensis]|uniref:Uncharacterized protein n=1 Tax=Calditerricola satsumensis TaxID=373054 RepID=A0A8J3FCJ0_9BACI|nr:hypothetical protein GCM10007043_23280 [Calditerricola satsumensis]
MRKRWCLSLKVDAALFPHLLREHSEWAGQRDPGAYWKYIPKEGKLYEAAARYFVEEHGKACLGGEKVDTG